LHADHSAQVWANGRGIPVDVEPKTGLTGVELVMTRLHAGGKFAGVSYAASGGLHGVGASVVNALSGRLDVHVDREGYEWAASFRRGVPGEFSGDDPDASFSPGSGLRKIRKVPKSQTGTITRFWPDRQIFIAGAELDFDLLTERARQTAYLVPGLSITVADERLVGQGDAPGKQPRTAEFHFSGGISEFCAHLGNGQPPVTDVLRLTGSGQFTETVPVLDDRGHLTPTEVERTLDVDIALRWDTGYNALTRSFVNVIATPKGGTHDRLRARAVKTINEWLRAARILRSGDDSVRRGRARPDDGDLASAEPQFEGQTRGRHARGVRDRRQVVNADLRAFRECLIRGSKPQAKALLEKVAAAARARIAAREHRENQRRKSALATSALPAKLVDCRSADDRSELFIVEGDSALGTAKLARDSEFQALLPIRGKILNVQKASLTDMQERVRAIIQVLGAGSGQAFDLDAARYQRVILMSVAPGEPVIFTDSEGRFTLRQIGSAVDERLESGGLDGVSGTVSVDLSGRSVRVSPVKQFIRHHHRGIMYRITTAYGRSVTVTGGHSIFSYRDGELDLQPASELKVGDLVVAPR
jgi:DNA gyrase subunit B